METWRELTQSPKRRRSSSEPHSSGEHPFLTPKGLQLQLEGNEADNVAPLVIPPYPDPRLKHKSLPATDPPVDPFNLERDDDSELQNVLPSKKFPQPDTLSSGPLTPYFQSSLVAEPRTTALRAIGKLFIQFSDDSSRELAYGSAWITGPDTIVTCAHNLFDFTNKTWSLALQFHPGYDYYSKAPSPRCRVVSGYIPRAYLDNPATNYDIAICTVDQNIGELVGAAIPMRLVDRNNFFDENKVAIVGYPAGSSFDFGKQMWQSRGEYLFGLSTGPGSDYAPAVATDFGGGASGCPWIVEEPFTGEFVAVGVTSGHARLRHTRGDANLMSLTSPYFGARMFDQLDNEHVRHRFQTD